MSSNSYLLSITLAVVLAATTPTSGMGETTSPASVTPGAVPAAGRHHALITVPAFGRYAITATSGQGVALQLTDRMAGPGQIAGHPGEQDGRIDLFLDRGQARLAIEGHPAARGEAQLAVRGFSELHTPQPPLLVEHKLVSATLDDLQQRSYWLNIEGAQWVALEAAGRHLADLRVWRDGVWLVDAEPELEIVEPKRGQPLLACRLSVRLERGLYLLTAYGGPGQDWAEGSDGRPFHLRWGIPTLPAANRQRFEVGPFGVDRFLVPGEATFVRLELPEARQAELGVTTYAEEQPFASSSRIGTIDKETVPPVTELGVSSTRNRRHLVSVRSEEGHAYVLQHFARQWEHSFWGDGTYWVSTIHAGAPQDSVDATAIAERVCRSPGADPASYAEDVLPLGPQQGLQRRFNLLEELTLFVRVAAQGPYEALLQGTEARVRFEPFLTSRPAHYQSPPFKPAGTRWVLDPGLYVVSVQPDRQGIVELVLRHADATTPSLSELDEIEAEMARVQGAAVFPSLRLDDGCSYGVYLNRQPGVSAGLVVRPLPLDLAEALPLVLQPGEEVEVPVRSSSTGTLAALAEDGGHLEVRVNSGSWTASELVLAGSHRVAVRNPRRGTVVASLRLVPEILRAEVPLPPMPDALVAGLPTYPVLTAREPAFFALGRGEQRTFLLRVDAPGLYRLESTGLLATSATLRSRVITALDAQTANGVGRNFLIQQYLQEGDYQLTVRTQGRSAGPLGVVLSTTLLRDGGQLENEIPARITLGEGEGASYTFSVPDAREYTLRTLGLGTQFTCRLETADEWPLEPPGGVADIVRTFDPGDYRLVLLPAPVPSRRVTLLAAARPPLRFEGHGPHPLALGQRIEHLWLEPEGDGPRLPDVWLLTLPAAATVRLALSAEVGGELLAAGAAQPMGEVPAGTGFRRELPAGRYELRVRAVRANNRLPYTVEASTEELLAGTARTVRAPVDIPISASGKGLVEIGSYGSQDVRADLVDARGALVATSDDRPDDWSFLLAAHLPPGPATVRVHPVGTSEAACTVSMRELAEIAERILTYGERRTLPALAGTHQIPLPEATEGSLLVVTASSREAVGLVLETRNGSGWNVIGQDVGSTARIAAVAPASGALRLRLWSADQRGLAVTVSAVRVAPQAERESSLAAGVALRALPGLTPPLAAAAVRIERSGLIRLEGEDVSWIGASGQSARRDPGGLAVAGPPLLWILGSPGARVKGQRVQLPADGSELAVAVQPGERIRIDLAGGPPGLGVVQASATAGQPVLRILGSEKTPPRVDRSMALAPRSALAVWLDARAPQAVEVWDGEHRARPLEVRLRMFRLAQPTPSVPTSLLDGELAPGQVIALPLPKHPSRLRLGLASGVVAVVTGTEGITSTHWSRDSVAEWLPGATGTLVLARLPSAPGTFSLRVLPADAQVRVGASRLVVREATAGTLRLDLPAAPGTWLRVQGAHARAQLVDGEGRVQRGDELDLASAGSLSVSHRGAPVLLWLAERGGNDAALWDDISCVAPTAVTPPAVVPLRGPELAVTVTLAERGLLHLRAPGPLLSRVGSEARAGVELHTNRLCRDVLSGPGEVPVGVRTVDGAPGEGEIEITTTRLVELVEGLGPEVLLAPGETRGFSFAVNEAGLVGLGVRADRDVVVGTLLDAAGQELGRGVALMPTLGPGTYVWALHAPAEGEAVRARPAVVGLVRPGTGPPWEVLERYLRPQSEPAPAAQEIAFDQEHEDNEEPEHDEDEGR